MTFIDAVFLASLLCGLVAAFKGSRTAWALLAGAAFTAGITLAEVPFHPILWMLIDLGVVLAIINPKMTAGDIVVIALFIPAWCLYAVKPSWISDAVTGIVAVQFFITFPLPAFWSRCVQPAFRRGGPPDIMKLIYA